MNINSKKPAVSKRLQELVKLMPKSFCTCDIGCDHGWLLIRLYLEGKIDHGIACDIVPGPLSSARKNIEDYRLGPVIETRLGDGLDPIQIGECDSCVIAGMGGGTIEGILLRNTDLVKSFRYILLQPMGQPERVRSVMASLGFHILSEELFFEKDIYYPMILFEPGKEEPMTRLEEIYGPQIIKNHPKELMDLLEQDIRSLNKVIENMGHSDQPQTKEKTEEYLHHLKELEVLKDECNR